VRIDLIESIANIRAIATNLVEDDRKVNILNGKRQG
jgi:hypothetical protein